MAVVLKHRHETGRGGGHEAFGDADLGERVAQIGDVLVEGLAVPDRDRPNTDRAARHIGAGHPRIGRHEIRVVARVEARLRRLVPGKPGQAVGDIGRIARFRHLAIIDDIDAGCRLAAHDREDRISGLPLDRRPVVRLALVLGDQQLTQFQRAGQAADMRGQDTVLARPHGDPRFGNARSREGAPAAPNRQAKRPAFHAHRPAELGI